MGKAKQRPGARPDPRGACPRCPPARAGRRPGYDRGVLPPLRRRGRCATCWPGSAAACRAADPSELAAKVRLCCSTAAGTGCASSSTPPGSSCTPGSGEPSCRGGPPRRWRAWTGAATCRSTWRPACAASATSWPSACSAASPARGGADRQQQRRRYPADPGRALQGRGGHRLPRPADRDRRLLPPAGLRAPERRDPQGGGTTNKTHVRDYEAAVSEHTRAILRVNPQQLPRGGLHRRSPPRRAGAHRPRMVRPRHRRPRRRRAGRSRGLRPAPRADGPESIAAGADLVCFSGDKLIGGPQAGLIVGRKDLVQQIRRHPADAHAARRQAHRHGPRTDPPPLPRPRHAPAEPPTLRMLTADVAALEQRARRIAESVQAAPGDLAVRVTRVESARAAAACPARRSRVVRWPSPRPARRPTACAGSCATRSRRSSRASRRRGAAGHPHAAGGRGPDPGRGLNRIAEPAPPSGGRRGRGGGMTIDRARRQGRDGPLRQTRHCVCNPGSRCPCDTFASTTSARARGSGCLPGRAPSPSRATSAARAAPRRSGRPTAADAQEPAPGPRPERAGGRGRGRRRRRCTGSATTRPWCRPWTSSRRAWTTPTCSGRSRRQLGERRLCHGRPPADRAVRRRVPIDDLDAP